MSPRRRSTGCIAVSLTKNLEEAEVVSWDVSEKALQVAERNCRRNGVRVTLEQRDVLLASPAGEAFFAVFRGQARLEKNF